MVLEQMQRVVASGGSPQPCGLGTAMVVCQGLVSAIFRQEFVARLVANTRLAALGNGGVTIVVPGSTVERHGMRVMC